MQACMNEAADLAALVAKLKEEHAKALEERDIKHAAEMSKLTEQLNNLSAKGTATTSTSSMSFWTEWKCSWRYVTIAPAPSTCRIKYDF